MECPYLVSEEVQKLRKDGIEPTLNELAELVVLGRRLENPPNQTNPMASRAPLAVGSSGLYLYPLSLQAEEWLDCVGGLLDEFGNAVVCFASATGRKAHAFDHLRTESAAIEAVEAWASTCTATGEELADAADRLIGGNEPEEAPHKEEETADDVVAILSDIAIESGQTVGYWLLQTSSAMIAALASINRKRAAAIGAEIRDIDGDRIRHRAVMWCVERIRTRASNGPE